MEVLDTTRVTWIRQQDTVKKQLQRTGKRPYIYIDPRRVPSVRLAWLKADCNTLGGEKTGY
jgi:hypothetical protein